MARIELISILEGASVMDGDIFAIGRFIAGTDHDVFDAEIVHLSIMAFI